MTNQHSDSLQRGEDDAAAIQMPGTDRVSLDYMISRIANVGYRQDDLVPHGTHCTILLDNGFAARGFSAPADPANFDAQFGAKLAYDDAVRSLWPIFGFLLCECRYQGFAGGKLPGAHPDSRQPVL